MREESAALHRRPPERPRIPAGDGSSGTLLLPEVEHEAVVAQAALVAVEGEVEEARAKLEQLEAALAQGKAGAPELAKL